MVIKPLKLVGILSSVAAVVFLFIISEGWLVGSVYLFGPYISFVVFTIFSVGTCLVIFYIYNYKRKSGNRYILKIDQWIEKKEANFSKTTLSMIRISKILGILFSGVTAGPLPTTVLILVLKYSRRQALGLIFTTNIIFFVIWIAIYSGAILIFQ